MELHKIRSDLSRDPTLTRQNGFKVKSVSKIDYKAPDSESKKLLH